MFQVYGKGTSQKVVPIMFKHEEGWPGNLPPQPGRDEAASSIKSRHPSIIYKISKVLQKYHNPDPIARLQIEGKSYLALIDSGVQLSALPESLVKKKIKSP